MAKSDKSDLFGLKRTLKKASNQNRGMRFLAVYIGLAIMVSFLALASLAPQLGEKLGMLSVKKQSQESEAATTTTTLKKYPKTQADCRERDTSQATTPYKRQNGCTITFQVAKASNPGNKSETLEIARGDDIILSWNAPDYNGWINPYTRDVKQIVKNGIPQADWNKKCEIRTSRGQQYDVLKGVDGKPKALENRGEQRLQALQPTVFMLYCRTADKHGNTAYGFSEVKVNTKTVTLQAPPNPKIERAECSNTNTARVVFDWDSVADVTGYRVEVANDPNFKNRAFKETSDATSRLTWMPSQPFTGDQLTSQGQTSPQGGRTYWWRVQSIRTIGAQITKSAVALPTPRSFSIPNCQ